MRILLLTLALLQGCSTAPKLDSFQAQSCLVVYCQSSESSKVKKAGLKLVEIAASTQNIELSLERGICEKYYKNTQLADGYLYQFKSAEQVCDERLR